jgi:hypothetical protein
MQHVLKILVAEIYQMNCYGYFHISISTFIGCLKVKGRSIIMTSDSGKNSVITVASQCTMFKYQAHNGSTSGYWLVFYAADMHKILWLGSNVTLHIPFSCQFHAAKFLFSMHTCHESPYTLHNSVTLCMTLDTHNSLVSPINQYFYILSA